MKLTASMPFIPACIPGPRDHRTWPASSCRSRDLSPRLAPELLGIKSAHPTNDLPFLIGDWLHRKPRGRHERHVGKLRRRLYVVELYWPRDIRDRLDVDALPCAGGV